MTNKFTIALPLAIGAGLLSATPANAATYNGASEIRAELRQLDRQVNRMHGLTYREEARLERRIDNVQALQRRYARNGYSRTELRTLKSKVNSIKATIRFQSRSNTRGAVKGTTRGAVKSNTRRR
ncbi:MAG: hypothetical protein ABJP34_06195 [Erythrobacter sp.]